MTLPKRLLLGVVFALAMAAVTAPGNAQEVVSRESELKGKLVAVLGKKYVTWPDNVAPTREKPLTVGILGTNPISVSSLKELVPTAVVKELSDEDDTDFQIFHILVVGRDANFDAAVAKAKGLPILIVSESPGLAKKGATMNLVFYQQQNRIRLEFNPDTAKRADIKVHPALPRSSFVDIVR